MHPHAKYDHSDCDTANTTGWGLLPHDAGLEWTAAGWSEGAAVPWWLHGFTPDQASHLRARLEDNASRAAAVGTTADSAEAWLASGLSREDITLSITNGFLTVAEGEAMAERTTADATHRSTLRLLTALTDLRHRLGQQT